MKTYKGNIRVPTDWKDLSSLPELYPGYTPGCHVEGDFSCDDCKLLTSLEGGPSSVNGDFYCGACKSLTSFEGAPQTVNGDFYCDGCESLKSLQGAPQNVTGDFSCNYCTSLTSLEGAPQNIVRHFSCNFCTSLQSLEGAPKSIGMSLYCSGCTSLRKPILSVFKIKNLKKIIINNKEVNKIVNKWLPSKDILECQEELIENGLKEYAKL